MNKTRKGGSEYVSSLIEEAIKEGKREAHVTGAWEIETAVRIPSDFTLYLDGCYLVMADGVYSNMFVNEHNDTDLGRTQEGRDRNISIIGTGEAVLDGGNYNGLSESSQFREGRPAIWKNNLILFTNLEGFKVSGLHCKNQRWWALNFIYCSDGYIGDMRFTSCDIGIDAEGNRYHGLIRKRATEALVFNSDGIDIRQGCHDILIENIEGFTEDDTVAITGLNGRLEKYFAVSGLSSDIHNITVREVAAESFCSIVRLLNQDGIKLYDVSVDSITNTWHNTRHMDTPGGGVLIGDSRLFGERNTTKEETYNITVSNVYGRGRCALRIACEIGNLVYENIMAHKNSTPIIDERVG